MNRGYNAPEPALPVGVKLLSVLRALMAWLGQRWDACLLVLSVGILAAMALSLLTPMPTLEVQVSPAPLPLAETPAERQAADQSMVPVRTFAQAQAKHRQGRVGKSPARPRKKKSKVVLQPHSVSINAASVTQLDALPGVGPKIARRIVEYRVQHGPFATLEQLQAVKGIGPKTFDKMADYLKL